MDAGLACRLGAFSENHMSRNERANLSSATPDPRRPWRRTGSRNKVRKNPVARAPRAGSETPCYGLSEIVDRPKSRRSRNAKSLFSTPSGIQAEFATARPNNRDDEAMEADFSGNRGDIGVVYHGATRSLLQQRNLIQYEIQFSTPPTPPYKYYHEP